MSGCKVYDLLTKCLRCKKYGKIYNSKLQEKAAFEGGRLRCGHEVMIHKLKMRTRQNVLRKVPKLGIKNLL